MKKVLTVIAAAAIMAGCSTIKPSAVEAPQVTAVSSQKLSTTFKRQGIKMEWDCAWGTGWSDKLCIRGDIKSIEVTGYATSNGNSEALRELAFRVAETQAKAKLRHFLQEDIYSSRVVNTISKNIEKANDRTKTRIEGEEVSMTDDEASKDTNWAIRENTNNVTRNVVETIRANAQGILRGVYVTDESIVDRQTVKVTIRWDQNSDQFGKALRKRFGN